MPVDVGDTAQVTSAIASAVAAVAACLTARHAQAQNDTARDALEAQTQPLLANVPYGI